MIELKIENILSGDKYVDQIFIYGDTLQNYLIAFIYPSKGALINLLQSKFNDININEENYKQYFEDENIKKDIIKDIDTYGRKNDLKGFELPKKIHLCKEPFSVENQIITPTMKIRRHYAKKFFAKEINKLYGF